MYISLFSLILLYLASDLNDGPVRVEPDELCVELLSVRGGAALNDSGKIDVNKKFVDNLPFVVVVVVFVDTLRHFLSFSCLYFTSNGFCSVLF